MVQDGGVIYLAGGSPKTGTGAGDSTRAGGGVSNECGAAACRAPPGRIACRAMSEKPVYVVSDTHLGAVTRETERAFRGFLDHVAREAASLLINGDLFDF